MDYERYPLNEELVVDQLVTFLYSELPSHYHSKGEAHNFWEFVYVDKGEIEIWTDSSKNRLRQGDIIFYKPNQFHTGQAENNSAPNLAIISFECSAPCMDFFQDRVFQLNQSEKDILSRIMDEGFKSFSSQVDSPMLRFPNKSKDAPFAGEQIIKNYLEILLIQLIRRGSSSAGKDVQGYYSINRMGTSLIDQIINFMEENISMSLSPADLCRHFNLSRTRIMTMFKRGTGMSIMQFFNKLKIDKAKELIRCSKYNFTEISDTLGFSSVHYFSKQFKTTTGMTPTEYARSVKAMIR